MNTLNMARIYVPRKEPGKGWRYKAIPRLEISHSLSRCIRQVRPQPYDTLEEAQRAATGLPTIAKAAAAGLTIEEYKDRENAHRIPMTWLR